MKSEKCGTKSKNLDVDDPVEALGLGHTSEALMGVEELEDLVAATKDDILVVAVTTSINDLPYLLSRLLHSLILCRYPAPIT